MISPIHVSALTYPDLSPPFDRALREAVAWVCTRFRPVGIVAGGSIVRGRPDPASDIDLYVIHQAPWRQRLQRRFNGVPFEIFVNPPGAVYAYFATEQQAARPCTAHMLATGTVVLDRDPVVSELREEATELLRTPPELGEDERVSRRYGAALRVEDAGDILDADPVLASQLMARALDEILALRFRQAHRFLPREKELLARLATFDPDLRAIVNRFWQAGDAAARFTELLAAADRVLEARGFFEWESDVDDVDEDE